MNISETTLNCCKPNGYISFKNKGDSEHSNRKVRYKHYQQMSDDVLRVKSVLDAHRDVQQSTKMKLFRAIPTITTGIVGASLAITQPGKLATKAGAGLGFLALANFVSAGVETLASINDKKEGRKNLAKTLGVIGGAAILAVGAFATRNTKTFKTITKFLSGEAKQLTKEINATKLGKFVQKTVIPFEKKHAKGFAIAGAIAPLAAIAGGVGAKLSLADSLSEDIKEKAVKNFAKGKYIQSQARAHFDLIEAQEV